MHIVCHLDKELYKCVTLDIVTDSVIITNERIKHIRERHPNDFEMYSKYMKDIIHNPDYILEANKPNTALIIKNIEDNDLRLILRIAVISDNPYYSNSVISFQKTHKREVERLLRSKKILYSFE